MLVLKFKVGERVHLSGPAVVYVKSIGKQETELAFAAADDVRIMTGEKVDAWQRQGIAERAAHPQPFRRPAKAAVREQQAERRSQRRAHANLLAARYYVHLYENGVHQGLADSPRGDQRMTKREAVRAGWEWNNSGTNAHQHGHQITESPTPGAG